MINCCDKIKMSHLQDACRTCKNKFNKCLLILHGKTVKMIAGIRISSYLPPTVLMFDADTE
jgi:hypothetical protein